MQFLKDLPQTTQLSIALVLVLLPVLAAIVFNKKKNAAATPADAASRKERRRRGARTAPQKMPRRGRRNLADETAQQLNGQLAGEADVDLIITPEDAEVPEGMALSTPTPSPSVTRDPHNALVSEDVPAPDDTATMDRMIEIEPAPAAVIDDPYVTVAAPVAAGSSVAQPGWPSPGELASGFDPDAFDPLPPENPAAVADANGELTDIDSGEAWLDENLTAAQPISLSDDDSAGADTQIIQVPTVDWDDDDDFDPATGWSDDGADVTPPVVAIAADEDADWVVPTNTTDDVDDEDGPTDDAALETPPTDHSDEPITVTVSATDDADDLTDWDEDDAPLTSVAWDAPETDDTFEDTPDTAEEPVEVAAEAWHDDDDPDDDDTWVDAGWSDDDPQELAMSSTLAVPYPAPGTLPAHEQVATLAVPFPVPGTLPAHEETAVRIVAESEGQIASQFTLAGAPAQMPAITGRIDTGTATPVVIDLANLVAHGERVEMVIEQDASGHGVRLRFGPSAATPTDSTAAADDAQMPADTGADPVADVAETLEGADTGEIGQTPDSAVAESTMAVPDPDSASDTVAVIDVVDEVAAPTPGEPDTLDIPFLTGGPRAAREETVVEHPADMVSDITEGGAQFGVPQPMPVSPTLAPTASDAVMAPPADIPGHRYDAAPEVVEPIPVGVSSLADDDPGKILADIRARLAALDQRRGAGDVDI